MSPQNRGWPSHVILNAPGQEGRRSVRCLGRSWGKAILGHDFVKLIRMGAVVDLNCPNCNVVATPDASRCPQCDVPIPLRLQLLARNVELHWEGEALVLPNGVEFPVSICLICGSMKEVEPWSKRLSYSPFPFIRRVATVHLSRCRPCRETSTLRRSRSEPG